MSEPRRRPVSAPVLALLALAGSFVLADLPEPAAGPELSWRADLEAALAEATASGRPAILSFHADWCAICRKLDRVTLRDPAVAKELDRFVRVRVDASRMSSETDRLLTYYGVISLPALIFVAADGAVVASPRSFGYVEVEELLPRLESFR